MYIRKVNKKNQATGEMYPTYRLVEAYRNTRGEPRQQVLLNLGSGFNIVAECYGSKYMDLIH